MIPFLQNILDLIYPQACFQCGSSIQREQSRGSVGLSADSSETALHAPEMFCAGCWMNVRRLLSPCCPVCAIPFLSEAALSHSPDHRCGECRGDPPFFSKAVTPFAYEETLAKAIQLFKYRKQTRLADPLACLLLNDLKVFQKIDRVMAIPLHPRRLRVREFNQSLLLAERIAHLLDRPLLVDAMERVRETAPQVGLSRKEREKNMKRAFQVVRPELIQDRRVLLVDDVYTTGATLREGAKTLIRGGAKEVMVTALARMI